MVCDDVMFFENTPYFSPISPSDTSWSVPLPRPIPADFDIIAPPPLQVYRRSNPSTETQIAP